MKSSILIIMLVGCMVSVNAQNQAPTVQQSTSTTNERGHNQTKVRQQKEAMRKQQAVRDTPTTKKRTLRPDSLRRGGATKVDTLR